MTRDELRQTILQPRQPRFKDVKVEAWGGVTVRIQGMTGEQRDAYEAETQRLEGETITLHRENLRARLLVRCLVDPTDNKRLFSNEEAPMLGQQPSEILDPLFVEAAQLSGVGATLATLKGNS